MDSVSLVHTENNLQLFTSDTSYEKGSMQLPQLYYSVVKKTIGYKQKSLRERGNLSFPRLGEDETAAEAVSSDHGFCFISFMTEQ